MLSTNLRHGVRATASMLAITTAMGFGGAAFAQTTTTTGQGDTTVGELVVTGTRASMQSAIARKKNAGTVVDSIVAEDVASFPDKNVGDALSRITGVQLSRDFGEGVQVSIRGVEPDLNRVEINGVGLPGSTYGGQATRGAEFRPVAAELVRSIDVYKGFTADMTEGGLGGTVQIETLQPLDVRKPFVSGKIEASRLDLTDTTKPRWNITASRKFFDDKLGIIVNATQSKTDLRQDYLSGTQWQRIADFDNSADKTTVSTDSRFSGITAKAGCAAFTVAADRTACETQWYDYSGAAPARDRMLIRNTERTSFDATIQYEITHDLRVSYERIYNKNKERLIDYNRTIDMTALSRFDLTRPVVVDANHNLIDWYTSPNTAAASGAGANLIYGTGTRDFRQLGTTDIQIGRFDYEHGPWWVRGIVSDSKGETVNDTNQLSFSATIPSIHIQLDELGRPQFTFPAGYDTDDPTIYNQVAVQYRPVEAELEEKMAKLDVRYDFADMPILTRLQGGIQLRENDSLSYAGGGYTDATTGAIVPSGNINLNANFSATGPFSPFGAPQSDPLVGTPGTGGAPPSVNITSNYNWSRAQLSQFIAAASGRTPGTFLDGATDRPDWAPDSWMVPNFDPVWQYFDISRFDHRYVRSAVGSDGKTYAQPPASDTVEKINAAYLRADYRFDAWRFPVSGNVGLRYVETEVTARGYITVRERRATTGNANGFTDVTVGVKAAPDTHQKYRDWIPAVNMDIGLIENQLSLRLGYTKLIARPQNLYLTPGVNCLFDVRPGAAQDSVDDTCTAGNPKLQPYRADEYDANLSWYPNRDTLVSVGYFYKPVKTFIVGPVLVNGVDLLGDGHTYTVTQRINGQGAKLQGVEMNAQTVFSWLPSPFDGLGAQVNATFTDAKNVGLFNALNGEELPFPGLSRWSYNIIAFYDKGPLNVRVAYNHRDPYLRVVAERSGNPVFSEGTGYLDAKATWRFDSHLSAYVEVQNLTSEREHTNSGDPVRTADWSYSGKRASVGLTFKY